MRPQTKGAGSTDIFRVNAPKIPHYPGAGLHWRDNSDYTALGPTPRPVYRALDMNIGPISYGFQGSPALSMKWLRSIQTSHFIHSA
jgi:hypothetical protein